MQRTLFGEARKSWRALYFSDQAPDEVLRALSRQDKRGNSAIMRVFSNNDTPQDGCKILDIFYDYLKRGVPAADLLKTLAVTNAIGRNAMHALFCSADEMMLMRWFSFLSKLLTYDLLHQQANVEQLYTILKQQGGYHGLYTEKVRPIGISSCLQTYIINAYTDFVLKLSRYGLSRSRVERLLAKKEGTLLNLFWKKAKAQTTGSLIDFIQSRFLRPDEYQQLVERKQDILQFVLQLESDDEKQYLLQQIITPTTPLGALFLHKARAEYRSLTRAGGLLSQARIALAAIVEPEGMVQLQQFTGHATMGLFGQSKHPPFFGWHLPGLSPFELPAGPRVVINP
tara:strand:- start:383 stop:1405 length:1023 start_codon:yes stop_codon:yes gene_type:complete